MGHLIRTHEGASHKVIGGGILSKDLGDASQFFGCFVNEKNLRFNSCARLQSLFLTTVS